MKAYSSITAVFEFGLGESTRLAAFMQIHRFSGIDSDADYVTACRDASPSYFKFYFADVGKIRDFGTPLTFLEKQALLYQLSPLSSELQAFDLYFVDGRYRVACVASSFLHASKYGRYDVSVLVHDYEREEYHDVETFATVVEKSPSGTLALLKRLPSASDELIFSAWKRHHNVID